MKCALFDLDGTVADTEVLKARALALAIQKFGGKALPETYRAVMGQSWDAVTRAFFDYSGSSIPQEIFNPAFRQFYCQLIEAELSETRSVTPFIEFLKAKGFSVGLVSSAAPWMIEKVLGVLKLEKAFEVIVSNADTDKHKPHPDAYLIALAKLQADPTTSLAFEDSESGFEAASSAGLTVYGIRHTYNEAHNFALCRRTLVSFDECLAWDVFAR